MYSFNFQHFEYIFLYLNCIRFSGLMRYIQNMYTHKYIYEKGANISMKTVYNSWLAKKIVLINKMPNWLCSNS